MKHNDTFDNYLDAIAFEKTLGEEDNFFYLHNDGKVTKYVIHGSVIHLTDMFVDIDELKDIILLSAAYIIDRDKLDFEKYLDGKYSDKSNLN